LPVNPEGEVRFAGLFRVSVREIVGAVDGFTSALQTSISIGENLLVNLSLRLGLRLSGDRASMKYQHGICDR